MAPEPATTIAAILQLKDQQRFDLMAVPAEILEQRRSGAGQIIVDVRLADDSTSSKSDGTTQERPCATMPLTIFLRSNTEFEDFKQHVGCTPLLFMCLNGQVGQQGLEVRTVKDNFFWRVAVGVRCDKMKAMNLKQAAAEHQVDVFGSATIQRHGIRRLPEPACNALHVQHLGHESQHGRPA